MNTLVCWKKKKIYRIYATHLPARCGTYNMNQLKTEEKRRELMFESLVQWKYYVKIQHEKPLKWPITKEKPQKIIFQKQCAHNMKMKKRQHQPKKKKKKKIIYIIACAWAAAPCRLLLSYFLSFNAAFIVDWQTALACSCANNPKTVRCSRCACACSLRFSFFFFFGEFICVWAQFHNLQN